MYSASLIAYKFVQRGIEESNPLTQMKLQKMVYLAQGLHLSMYDGLSLIREDFQAWKYGPVIPIIYQDYKLYGSSLIQDLSLMNFNDFSGFLNTDLNYNASSVIDDAWKIAKDIPGTQLSNWTHNEGSPWHKFYKEGVNDIIIPKDEIKVYFSKFIKHAS
ncbi:Panacea domain-containing protein [Pedobacter miscanthi]|uniref:Antitoxin SocA-like Panacea domain-containing protein n=1 Tax=Pedobacter miscanthi TaxID=2259170 RepID=A0A366KX86_9SPHI|nr:type II toxin-antitoxin system antitoxin SocA domain-containing protein [Pedobacter miscanthi]RBQ06257.1 hypothetical protein DRW42_14310 [Pedobacter miscanthi]